MRNGKINLFFLSFFLKYIYAYIKLPVYTYHSQKPNETSSKEYVEYFSKNAIYTNLSIGNPPQKVVATLNFNNYPLVIAYNVCDIPSYFSINDSYSYSKKDNGNIYIAQVGNSVATYLVNDSFYFSENNPYILSYIFAPLITSSDMKYRKTPYTCIDIGLKMQGPYYQTFTYNFIMELKILNIINNYVCFIEFDDNDDDLGNFVVGIEPYEYNPQIYNFSDLRQIYSVELYAGVNWQMKFDSIYISLKSGDNITKNEFSNVKAGLNPNLKVIFGTFEYREFIEKNFFNDRKNVCKMNKLEKSYYNYECNSLEVIKEFPKLSFIHRNLGVTFEMTYEDLFIKYGDSYMTVIWIDMDVKNRNYWILGKPFLKKYFFSYDIDKKLMSYYPRNKYNINSDKVAEEEDGNDTDTYKYIIIAVCIIVVGVLGFFLAKFIYNKRKKNLGTQELMDEVNEV